MNHLVPNGFTKIVGYDRYWIHRDGTVWEEPFEDTPWGKCDGRFPVIATRKGIDYVWVNGKTHPVHILLTTTYGHGYDLEGFVNVVGYDGYQIHPDGRLWRESYVSITNQRRGNKFIATQKSRKGYIRLTIRCKTLMLHRLLAVAFIPNPENKSEVNHINGIKDDNRLCNLEWVTGSENMLHSYAMGLHKKRKTFGAGAGKNRPYGERSGHAKLTDAKVLEILALYRDKGMSPREISEIYGVHRVSVNNILLNKAWKHVKRPD